MRPLLILILIGYSDHLEFSSPADLVEHDFNPSVSQVTESRFTRKLGSLGFQRLSDTRWIRKDRAAEVTLLNANVPCESDTGRGAILRRSNSACAKQREHSRAIAEFVQMNLSRFHEFIYIGHSRNGLGFGIGPAGTSEFAVSVNFYNPIEQGQLRKAVIASCDSNHYYSDHFYRGPNFEFIGTDGRSQWVQELLPWVSAQLESDLAVTH